MVDQAVMLDSLRTALLDPRVTAREIEGRWWCCTHDGVEFSRAKAPHMKDYEGSFYYRPTEGRRRGEQDHCVPRHERVTDPVCGIGVILGEIDHLLPGSDLAFSRTGCACRAVVTLADGGVFEADGERLNDVLLLVLTDALIAGMQPQALPGPKAA